ncbi:MAG: M3 family oligoendopeptidase [Actinomycetota bacterium]
MSASLNGSETVQWDLSDLYNDYQDPAVTKDLDQTLADAKSFKDRYHGHVSELDAPGLLGAVIEIERMSASIARIGAYSYLVFSTDAADPARGAFLQKVREQATVFSTELLFFRLEWMTIDEDRAASLVADPSLATYRHYLESARRYKPFVLSEAEEKLLTEKSVSGSGAWSRLFTELTTAFTVSIEGEKTTMEAALAKLQGPDREVRRVTAESITATLDEDIRTRAFVFNTLLLDKSTDDRLRGYPDWISARNLGNEASDESVQVLIDSVVSRYDISHRFYALKARLLGLDRIADYDRFAPVTKDSTSSTWQEASSLVRGAYEEFSPIAGQIIGEFFDKEWIDAAATSSKVPGAYCMTLVPERHPYVMMSFTGDRRSVLVLAHELGHGLHGYLAGHQGMLNAASPLTLSETASVFGEALTFGKLLAAETDPTKRLALLNGRLEDAVATVFRQIGINRFEDSCHRARRAEGEISVESFNTMWAEAQKAVLGDSVEITDGYRKWWSYIPHFIASPGYVYAYAYGYLFSLAIYQKYVLEGESMVEPYLDLLRAGGSDSPERLAKIVGIDLSDPEFWAGGLQSIDALLAEAEKLAAELA